jgi:predicted Ser/Thr protein kinase
MSCPNVLFHRAGDTKRQQHLIDGDVCVQLLRRQLMETLDRDIEPLWKQGARGIMFKVTLSAYGYTALGKGTVDAFVDDLQHEATVYSRLQRLQGVCVPVFLGAFDLPRPYYYDFKVRIVHMMFLSWSGDHIEDLGSVKDEELELQRRERELARSLRSIHMAGILHKNIRTANILWYAETQRVFLIDFENRHCALVTATAYTTSEQSEAKALVRFRYEAEHRQSQPNGFRIGDCEVHLIYPKRIHLSLRCVSASAPPRRLYVCSS